MNFKVDKNEVVRVLECIIETQSDEVSEWRETSIRSEAKEMLLTFSQIAAPCNTLLVTEDEALFLVEYLQ